MKKIFFLLIIFVLLLALSNGLADNFKNSSKENAKYIKIAGQTLTVSLAIDREAQIKGLSGRKEIAENEGMLFLFSYPAPKIWMKNMNFPIDIIWLAPSKDEAGKNRIKVVYIKKDARPELYPEVYGPDVSISDARYVLEVASGFSDKNNLKIGDLAEFTF